jgi:hypothetical protein
MTCDEDDGSIDPWEEKVDSRELANVCRAFLADFDGTEGK